MRALFLRHGESAHNAHSGAEPLPEQEGDRLTEVGIEQAHAAGVALAGYGVTRLLSSPLRRARETAAAVGEAIGLEAEELPYAYELHAEESFEETIERVRRLKAELEAGEAGELPLLVTHGIITRFFLLDSVLGDAFEAGVAGGIWNLGSHNCGLTTFAFEEARYPNGEVVPGWACLTWMERPWSRP